jgi:hypothetical protein
MMQVFARLRPRVVAGNVVNVAYDQCCDYNSVQFSDVECC